MPDQQTRTRAVNEGALDVSARDFVVPLFRRKRALAITFVASFALLTLLAVVLGPTYSSRMEILVNRERVDPVVSAEATTQMVTANFPVAPEEINSEIELLKSRDVLEKVVRDNGLEKPQPGFSLEKILRPNASDADRAERQIKKLAKQLKIDVVKNSNLIEVAYSKPDPQVAYGVLKSLENAYMAKHVQVHSPAGSYEFFATETQKYKDELQKAEDKLREFSRQSGIGDPDEQRTQLAGQVAASIGIQHAAEQAVAADEERIKEDQRQLAKTPQRSPTLQASATNDKLISDLNDTLIAAQAKRTQLAMKYDAGYPLVQEADREVEQAKTALARAEATKSVSETTDRDPTYELVREDVAKTRADLSSQRATLAATKQSVQNMQAEMVKLDQLTLSQADLQREAKADESNYLLYLGKREQERTSNALDVTRISNVAIAVPPAIPVLPVLSLPLSILIAFAVSIVLSLAVAYGLDYFDSSFHTPAEVIDILGVPVVVTVSKKTA